MSYPLGTISKRARLEVGLEDRLQYELERPLHHPISDRRNREEVRRRVESWTSVGARASASSGSTSAASAVDGAHGVPTTRRSSRNALRCYGSSRTCSAATNRSQWIGSCS